MNKWRPVEVKRGSKNWHGVIHEDSDEHLRIVTDNEQDAKIIATVLNAANIKSNGFSSSTIFI